MFLYEFLFTPPIGVVFLYCFHRWEMGDQQAHADTSTAETWLSHSTYEDSNRPLGFSRKKQQRYVHMLRAEHHRVIDIFVRNYYPSTACFLLGTEPSRIDTVLPP